MGGTPPRKKNKKHRKNLKKKTNSRGVSYFRRLLGCCLNKPKVSTFSKVLFQYKYLCVPKKHGSWRESRKCVGNKKYKIKTEFSFFIKKVKKKKHPYLSHPQKPRNKKKVAIKKKKEREKKIIGNQSHRGSRIMGRPQVDKFEVIVLEEVMCCFCIGKKIFYLGCGISLFSHQILTQQI